MIPELIIDPEFQGKCPPLTDEELNQLRENIISEGAIWTPIIVWNNTIVDGHNRYTILLENPHLEFTLLEKKFDNRFTALSWICKNQLGRRNLTSQQKKYLVGQRYEAEKKAANCHGNQYTVFENNARAQNEHEQKFERTCEKIAAETHCSPIYVRRANEYAKGVDAADACFPGIKQDLLSGKIKPTAPIVAAIARAPLEERYAMTERLRKTDDPSKNSKKTDRRDVLNVYAGMLNADGKVSDESALDSLRAASQDFIRISKTLFSDFPNLLKKMEFREKTVEILQEPKKFILEIEKNKRMERK